MAGMPGIVIQIGADGSKALNEFKKVEKALGRSLTTTEKANVVMAKYGKALGAAAAAGAIFAIKIGVDAVNAASSFNETVSKTGVIFDDQAERVVEFAKGTADSYGIAAQAALDAADKFGQFGKAAGLTGDDLAFYSESLVRLAGDMASFNDVDPTEVINAMGSALAGQSEPMRRFGVDTSDAALKAAYFGLTGEKVTGVLTQQQKALAAQAAIMEQTTDQQGDAARTADSLANQTRRLTANLSNLQLAFGQGLQSGIGNTNEAVGAMADAVADAQPLVVALGRSLGGLIQPLGSVAGALGKTTGAFVDAAGGADSMAVSIAGFLAYLNPLTVGLRVAGAGADVVADSVDNARVAFGGASRASQALTARLTAQATASQRAAFAANQLAAAEARTAAAKRASSAVTDRYTALARAEGKQVKSTGGNLTEYFAALNKVNVAQTGTTSGGGSGGTVGATEKVTKAAKAQAQQWDDLVDSVDATADALKSAQSDIDAAWQKMREGGQRYADWLTSGVDLGDAFKQSLDAAGTDAATTWYDAFTAQIASTADAAQAMKALSDSLKGANIPGGGAEALMAQLMSLPPEQAALIANELVANGLAPELARQLGEMNLFAGQAGITWSNQFVDAGVEAAYAQYNAISDTLTSKLEALYKLGKKMGKAVADGYNDATAGIPQAARSSTESSANTRASTTTVNVTVQGAIDPVGTARQINRVLRTGQLRTGLGF